VNVLLGDCSTRKHWKREGSWAGRYTTSLRKSKSRVFNSAKEIGYNPAAVRAARWRSVKKLKQLEGERCGWE
jgi:hypothetical protein